MNAPSAADPGRGLAHAFIGLSISLMFVSTTLFIARIWTRMRPIYRMSYDDYFAVLAYCCVITCTVLLLQTVRTDFPGKEKTTFTLQDIQKSYMFAVIAEVFWTWSMTFTKISVAFMLLRFEPARYMRLFLWFMVGFLFTMGMFGCFTQVLQCQPLSATWDLLNRHKAKCWDPRILGISGQTINCINATTDILFALLPISFLRKVKLPRRERIMIGILMGLGVFVAVVCAVKTYYISQLGKGNPVVDSIRVGFLSSTEALLAFATCCIPCLRAPLQRALEKLGLVSANYSDTDSSDWGDFSSRSRTKYTTETTPGIRMNDVEGGEQSGSDRRALTGLNNGENLPMDRIWQITEAPAQGGFEEIERVRTEHTRVLHRAESLEILDKIDQSHTPALPPKKRRSRRDTMDAEAAEEIGESSETKRKSKGGIWWK
ncbi:hypothetical protein DM02DRAFT_554159 [Periconia macrospinosa]|uniref:Rhodopsin domain-containing protein n=1 Tax=Periconia macrospinosa TaxID=97972 RepID=A0A2V1E5E0_9PLEO|nr:hypothetical protein DM02DRAFT_554159 [Periconia macrospinosa]